MPHAPPNASPVYDRSANGQLIGWKLPHPSFIADPAGNVRIHNPPVYILEKCGCLVFEQKATFAALDVLACVSVQVSDKKK